MIVGETYVVQRAVRTLSSVRMYIVVDSYGEEINTNLADTRDVQESMGPLGNQLELRSCCQTTYCADF